MMHRKTTVGVSAALLAVLATASCSSGNRSEPVTFGDRMAQSASQAAGRADEKSAFAADWKRGEKMIEDADALTKKSDRDVARADREIRKLTRQLEKLKTAKATAEQDRVRARLMSAEGYRLRARAEAEFRGQFPDTDID